MFDILVERLIVVYLAGSSIEISLATVRMTGHWQQCYRVLPGSNPGVAHFYSKRYERVTLVNTNQEWFVVQYRIARSLCRVSFGRRLGA